MLTSLYDDMSTLYHYVTWRSCFNTQSRPVVSTQSREDRERRILLVSDCLFVPTKSAKRKSVKYFDKDWAGQLRRFAPSRFDKLSVMLYLHRFGEVVDIKPIFYCTTRSKNYNQLVINCWRYLALVRKVESTLQHSRKGCARHTTANKQR